MSPKGVKHFTYCHMGIQKGDEKYDPGNQLLSTFLELLFPTPHQKQ